MRRPDRALRPGLVLGVALLAGCAVARPPAPATVPLVAALPDAGPVCRVGPGGGPIEVADRGIGGTGSPARLLADRGIGGTGISPAAIGTTGLVGVITGFASLCLAGQEVAYGPGVPVSINGRPGQPSDFRAGQVAAVEASGGPTLSARRVLVRHEVVGPVQAREAGLWRIGGQRVAVGASTLGLIDPAIGAWVAVSGLRDPDGIIQATRIDPAPVQPAVLHGTPLREGGRIRIGTAEIRLAPGVRLPAAGDVRVVGRWVDGVLLVDDAQPDPLADGAAALFGPAVGVVVVESFAGLNEGRLLLTRTRDAGPGGFVRSTVSLERRMDGALRPAFVGDGPGRAGPGAGLGAGLGAGAQRGPDGFRGGAGRFQPAPLPNRAIQGPRGSDSTGGPRSGPNGDRGRGGQGGFPGGFPNALPGGQTAAPTDMGGDGHGPRR